MGMVAGKIDVEEAAYEKVEDIGKDGWEIRKYLQSVAIDTKMEAESDSAAFRRLAGYIGVFSDGQNQVRGGDASEKIAMTAPVIMSNEPKSEKIAMTAPVLMSGEQSRMMTFILPRDKYKRVEDAPVPTNDEVHLRQIEDHLRAVLRFTGSWSEAHAKEQAAKLYADIAASDKYALAEGEVYQRAGFNPPWTLPWLRTNEVQVSIVEKTQ